MRETAEGPAMTSWQEEYRRKLISAEAAAGMVKAGDLVLFTPGREAHAVGLALAARKEELRGVKVYAPSPGYDFGWYDPGWEESFNIIVSMVTATSQEAVDQHLVDIDFGGLIPFQEAGKLEPDVLLTEVSPPNERGFCSFGASLWNKRRLISRAKIAIAEVNKNLIRTFGDNYIHISEIDYFVEHLTSGKAPGMGSLAGREIREPEPYLKTVAGYVNQLLNSGDTIQIGVGRTTEPLVRLGMLAGKEDLGYHSEATPPGIITLVKEGVITGKYKTVNPGKCVVTTIGGSTREEMEWVDNNPLFHLVDVEYLEDIRVIAAHDNMVAINNILAIDLGGQIASEGLGTRTLAVAGGQIAFVYGAWLSKGGRSIMVLPATAQGGKLSRIAPTLPSGTPVTIQRNLADTVITEYGVARLRGKTLRERAEALISIAHPDFRAELKREARRMWWP